jgi:uncharacterized membrane protein YqjE
MTEHDDRSLGDLFGRLANQVSSLVRQEIALARTETTARASAVGRDVALIAAGGALLYAALLVVLGAIVLLLIDAGLDGWIAALLVGVLVALVGGGLVLVGRDRLKAADVAPRRTIETLQDDAEWAKERLP